MPKSWTESEVSAIIADYCEMLTYELKGIPYNKSEHRRRLAKFLNNRSDGSIERKHQNISAVLIELGMPYISGYKPLKNYQRSLLPEMIQAHLKANSEIQVLIAKDTELRVEVPEIEDILRLMVYPPESEDKPRGRISEPMADYKYDSVNYLLREATNRELGLAGEKFIINYEKAWLIAHGKESLADKIVHVSVEVGDSAGYDIHSFTLDNKDRMIEAKTTKYGINTPFFVTANELSFSIRHRESYSLYRVFDFRHAPHIFSLKGSLEERCRLTPTTYMARV